MDFEEKLHPTVGVLVRPNGEILVPATSRSEAHWTFGNANRAGYKYVTVNGIQYPVHRLVAEVFLENSENLVEIDHINRNPGDNRVENLRYCTHSANCRNRSSCDAVDSRGGTHYYGDRKAYYRERGERYRKSNKCILFADGKKRWVSNEEGILLLAVPITQRFYKG